MDFKKLVINILLDDLFAVAKLRSAVIASHIKDNEGNSQVQALAITDADRSLWDIFNKEYANKVYSYLIQAGKIKEGSYKYGVDPIAYNNGIVVEPFISKSLLLRATANQEENFDYTFSLVGTNGGANKAQQVTLIESGLLTYTPAEDVYGKDKVDYQITDANGNIYYASVYVNISNDNILPVYPKSGFYIKYDLNLSTNWDVNLAQGLTDLIQKAIVSGGLFEWFKSTSQYDAAKIYQQEYMEALQDAKQNINKRLYIIRRPHVTF